jgi:solute carrier family 6 amino acid/orphan transporter-like 15/16/17/18/20
MFTPDMNKLFDARVWLDAATQIFYSMGLAFGGLIAFSSYNPPKNNVKRDVITLSIANIVTSMYTAIVIFAILGYKGHINYNKCLDKNFNEMTSQYPDILETNRSEQALLDFKERLNYYAQSNFTDFSQQWKGLHTGDSIQYCDFTRIIKDAAEGTGLAFIVFTQAMVEFPGSPFWAVIFFLMLLSLGLGSMFGTLEGVITSIYDLRLFTWLKKPVLTAILCGFSCLVGLIFVSRAGEFWVKLFDSYAGSYALMAVAFWEVIGVVYVYGWKRFCDDIEDMTGQRPGLYWQITWRFLSPVIMFVLFFASLITSVLKESKYYGYSVETGSPVPLPYPAWCKFIAGCMVFTAMVPVPFVAFVRYFKIWKFEKDIPMAEKGLNATPSTAYMLKSQASFGGLESGISLDGSLEETEAEGNGETYQPNASGDTRPNKKS